MSPQQRYNQNDDGSVADISSAGGSFDLSSSHAESSHDPKSKSSGGESSTGGASSSGNSTGNSSFELFGFTRFHFQAVSCSRWIFLGTLLVAAVGLATAVYFILHNEQVEAFESEFENLAFEIVKVTDEHVRSVFKIMDGVTTTVTSFVEFQQDNNGNNTSYPSSFLTLPHMEQHFGTARNASGALLVAYVPTIAAKDLQLWNTYSQEYQEWISDYNIFHNDDRVVEPIFPSIWQYPEDDETHEFLNQCKSESTDTEQGDYISDRANREVCSEEEGPFAPIWTFSPAPKPDDVYIVNHDLLERVEFERAVRSVDITRHGMFLDVCNLASWFNVQLESQDLEAVLAYPVFDTFDEDAKIMGHMIEVVPYGKFFQDILPEDTKPLRLVLESSCGQAATYEIQGRTSKLLAKEDRHDKKYDHLAVTELFAEFANPPDELSGTGLEQVCVYTTTVYPTLAMEEEYNTRKPIWYALVVLAVFFLTSILFFLFDVLMTRQRDQVMETAKKQNAIVSSLFPKSIQAKMMQQIEADSNKLSKVGKAGLKKFLFESNVGGDGEVEDDAENARKPLGRYRGGPADKSKPIADLFPETTIMFGDISGFTVWSSAREPSQVFTLLETIYHAFDVIAKRRRVFKVEVVGDCYVAVCGLPDPRKDHAVIMARFAMDCVKEMKVLVSELEVELGPDTADLGLRVGLHSGPVVAGVLRGDKSRFQLFGDTMNTASRMESTGIPDRIQISQETADLLTQAGKGNWCEARAEKVAAKGKGELTTYFLAKKESRAFSSVCSSGHSTSGYSSDDLSFDTFREPEAVLSKRNRVADWSVETLAGILREIQLRRLATRGTKKSNEKQLERLERTSCYHEDNETVISELQEIVELPHFDATVAEREAAIDIDEIELPQVVMEELTEYVRTIASMYHSNPFHNFSHANHVTLSVVKLLGRIQAPDLEEVQGMTLHDHTYGITSDPLTRLACVFAALIHDVDHMGVPNAQLVKEQDPVAILYHNKSVAEQNSIDLAWDLLMEPRFRHLRRQIYSTESEYKRFRQLVVNGVLATDIMDKDLKELRNRRWDNAFDTTEKENQSSKQAIDRKATIVIQHLIQASDVAHTMQHWHIYRKWNEKLFLEMYQAYQDGRMEKDPSTNWYEGEMGFFDFYIIPLAKKLKECGVFGVSSDEYLNYALQNRKEWELRGQEIVAEYMRTIDRKQVARQLHQASAASVELQGKEIIADLSTSLRKHKHHS